MAERQQLQYDEAETLFNIIQTCGDCPTGRKRERLLDDLAEHMRQQRYDPTGAAMGWLHVIDVAIKTDPEASARLNHTTRRALALDLEDTYRPEVEERAGAGIIAAHYRPCTSCGGTVDADRATDGRSTCTPCYHVAIVPVFDGAWSD